MDERTKVERCRGFAFIEFEKMEQARKAVIGMNGKEILNRIVAVDFTLPKDKFDAIAEKVEDEKTEVEEEGSEQEDEEMEEVDQESGDEEEELDEMIVEKQEEPVKKVYQPPNPSWKSEGEDTLFIRNLSFESEESELQEKYYKKNQIFN